jgi:branched-chain amino acid transport system substrate-binding protein
MKIMWRHGTRSRNTLTLIAAGCLLLAVFGRSQIAAGQSRAAQPASSPITIGASLSLSGDFSADGVAFQQGYKLWESYVNSHGGIMGRKVKLIILSDASSPTQVVTDYQKLATIDRVDLMFGPFSTLLTKQASVVVNRYGYALVEGAGGGPSVFTRGLHNIFDVSLPVASNLVSFSHWILSLPKSKRPKTAAYATEDDPFTAPQLVVARGILQKGGVKTVYNKTYPSETTDFTPIADAVIHSKAQIGLFGTLLPDISAFIKTFEQQHYNPKAIIATAGPDQGSTFLNAIGGTRQAEGILVPNGGWYPQIKTYQNKLMVSMYLHKYHGKAADISSDVAEAFAVGQVTAQAIIKAHSVNKSAVMNALHSGTFKSVQGPVRFNSVGENVLATSYLFQWHKGKLVPVFPAKQAKVKPEYPKPAWR